ncbi:NAD(P)-binding protein [Lophium mytilinum]|uniref:NAD(P)-binding protein n=1 Tax=Lophium mytilinum TaxID=390894 RepID=A0A6A6QGS5_9PEZI|nr:NAD(P)-binding protein [Lophium mytilinum]
MAFTKTALIGANGTLGPHIVSALQASPSLNLTIITRASSKSTYGSTPTISVPDDLPTSALTDALKGFDALVITMAGSYVAECLRLADAAFAAGVKRIIPPDFGSCDSADPETLEILPLMAGKAKVRAHLEELCGRDREGGKMTWTSLITGHFFDYGLRGGLLCFDVRKKKVQVLDGGDVKFSATNLDTIGTAVVKVLTKEEQGGLENKLLYVHSFHVTQNELLEVLEMATGSVGKWELEQCSSKELLAVSRPKMLKGDGHATEEVVAVHGIVASDWEGKEGFANELLSLEKEDLVECVTKVVESL